MNVNNDGWVNNNGNNVNNNNDGIRPDLRFLRPVTVFKETLSVPYFKGIESLSG
ncbi:hypothetical protein [Hominisplanchenecus murintestinalis]|uniref:hypothetical protein n=1 Tax=Hominisplanchenecus murintestinalis TaxID=2941517 RepID=UPI001441A484|nr:hypothetical protein [Hominisplanchenecus murintestinalis]